MQENTTIAEQQALMSEITPDENHHTIEIATVEAGVSPLQIQNEADPRLQSITTPAENTTDAPQQGDGEVIFTPENEVIAGNSVESGDAVPQQQPAKNVSSKKTLPHKPASNAEKSERLTMTVSFPGTEGSHLKNIIDERVKAGLTRDNSHFIRQCVDFAINYEHVFKKKGFAIPEGTPKMFLKDAYFNNQK